MGKKKQSKEQKMVDTIIGSDTVIEGNIKHPTSLRIDGKVFGTIECEGDVYIGKEGYAEPAIHAKNIMLAGEAEGDLHTSEKVIVHPTGKLSGTTTTKGFIIEDGGMFNGESTIIQDEAELKNTKKESSDNAFPEDEHFLEQNKEA